MGGGLLVFLHNRPKRKLKTTLMVDSPFVSTTVLSKTRLFPQFLFVLFLWFPEKKDPWKEWEWKVPLEQHP